MHWNRPRSEKKTNEKIGNPVALVIDILLRWMSNIRLTKIAISVFELYNKKPAEKKSSETNWVETTYRYRPNKAARLLFFSVGLTIPILNRCCNHINIVVHCKQHNLVRHVLHAKPFHINDHTHCHNVPVPVSVCVCVWVAHYQKRLEPQKQLCLRNSNKRYEI